MSDNTPGIYTFIRSNYTLYDEKLIGCILFCKEMLKSDDIIDENNKSVRHASDLFMVSISDLVYHLNSLSMSVKNYWNIEFNDNKQQLLSGLKHLDKRLWYIFRDAVWKIDDCAFSFHAYSEDKASGSITYDWKKHHEYLWKNKNIWTDVILKTFSFRLTHINSDPEDKQDYKVLSMRIDGVSEDKIKEYIDTMNIPLSEAIKAYYDQHSFKSCTLQG